MDKRTEARIVSNSRAFERRFKPREGAYAASENLEWFAVVKSATVSAATEGAADPDGNKERTPGGGLVVLYRFDRSEIKLKPKTDKDGEPMEVGVLNWSKIAFSQGTMITTEVRGGKHWVKNGECPAT